MSTLIILLAAQPRLADSSVAGHAAPDEFDYVLSVDGQRDLLREHGYLPLSPQVRAEQLDLLK